MMVLTILDVPSSDYVMSVGNTRNVIDEWDNLFKQIEDGDLVYISAKTDAGMR